MEIKIKCFGLLAEAMNTQEALIRIKENSTVYELKSILFSSYPILEGKEFKVVVNKNIAKDNTILLPKDELALLPPFAGG